MINRYRVMFLDQFNIARSKYIGEVDRDVRFCVGSYSTGYSGKPPIDMNELISGYYDIDAKLDPDPRKSWEPQTEIVLADMHLNDTPFPFCARSVLKGVVEAWRAKGLEPIVGYETEANIFEKDGDGWKLYNKYRPQFYTTGAFSDPESLIDDIWNMADWCGLPLESVHTECEPSQFEFTMKCDKALNATDNVFLFRQMAREMLIKRGYLLSYMPVPKTRGWNALHFNISFRDSEGNNVFATDSMSDIMKSSIAGLLHHHKSLAAIVAPTVNSYERVQYHRTSGYWANWSRGTRHCSIRVSTETGERARIEYRVGDHSANPYLALAAILYAMLIGYENQYALPDSETNENLEDKGSDQHTPHSLKQSLEHLKNDQVLSDALGKELIDHYINLKNHEILEIGGKSIEEQFDYYCYFI